MYLEKLSEMCRDSVGQKTYLDWLGDPVTQLFIGSMREAGRPQRPDIINEAATYLALGESLGMNAAADMMESPRHSGDDTAPELEASYGAAPVA
jgi:hypothetical protein